MTFVFSTLVFSYFVFFNISICDPSIFDVGIFDVGIPTQIPNSNVRVALNKLVLLFLPESLFFVFDCFCLL
jgi:hypothetical protein